MPDRRWTPEEAAALCEKIEQVRADLVPYTHPGESGKVAGRRIDGARAVARPTLEEAHACIDSLADQLEAAQKRIAELEQRSDALQEALGPLPGCTCPLCKPVKVVPAATSSGEAPGCPVLPAREDRKP